MEKTSSSLYVILAEGFLSRLSFGVIGFVLPIFAFKRMGLSLTQVGLIFTLSLLVEQLFKPLMGWVADHAGLKRTYTVAIALRSTVALLFIFATAPWQIYAIRMLHGFSESLRDPSVGALIAEYADKKKMASAFAWYTSLKMSAGSLGQALAGVLLYWWADDYARVFLVAFVLSILPLSVVAWYLKEPPHHPSPEVSPERPEEKSGNELEASLTEQAKPQTSKKSDGSLLPVLVLGSLMTSTAMMISKLFPVLATEYAHLNAAQAGLIYTAAPLVTIFAGPAFGWLADNVSQRFVLLVRGFANICSSLLFWFVPTFGGLAAGNVIDALGKAAFRPAWGKLMAQAMNANRERRARVTSYFGLGEGIGETVGPLLGGWLWQYHGVAAMLGVRVALAAVAEIYALIVARTNNAKA